MNVIDGNDMPPSKIAKAVKAGAVVTFDWYGGQSELDVWLTCRVLSGYPFSLESSESNGWVRCAVRKAPAEDPRWAAMGVVA